MASSRITPLLQQLPSLLGYPFRGSMAWMLAALCFLRLLNHLPSLLGLVFELAFWLMAFKLAVEALVNTAHGRLEPLGSEDLMATDGEAVEQILLLLVVYLPILAVGAIWGAGPSLFLLVASILVLPASVILLAMEHSLPRALNPLAWGALWGRLGGAYVNVVVVLGLLVGVSIGMQWLLDAALPSDMDSLPGSFVSLYALIAGYHVLGYLIHERHEALGLDISTAVPRATYAGPLEDQAMLNAAALADQEKPAAAADRLQDMFRGRGASDPLHDRYRQYVIAAGDVPRLVRHSREYIASLLATGKDRRAVAVAAETLAADPTFRHEMAADVARLVAQAAKNGQSQLAVSLAEDFESRFPGDEAIPQVVLTAATLMAEKLGREQAACLRLRACLGRHGEHALAPKLREAMAHAERLGAISRGAGVG